MRRKYRRYRSEDIVENASVSIFMLALLYTKNMNTAFYIMIGIGAIFFTAKYLKDGFKGIINLLPVTIVFLGIGMFFYLNWTLKVLLFISLVSISVLIIVSISRLVINKYFNKDKINTVKEYSNMGVSEQSATVENTCPRCGNMLVVRNGIRGKFWGCKSYPNCRYTKNIN